MGVPNYAVVEMLCDPALLGTLEKIPNLKIEIRPIRTADPSTVRIGALADEAAQAAARALGCDVKVVKSAEDYRKQVDEAYRDLDNDPKASRPR